MSEAHSQRRELIQDGSGTRTKPFSLAVRLDEMVWTSGALPVRADGTVAVEFADQVRDALENLERALHAAGADWSTVVKINGYVRDIERLPELNVVYEEIVNALGAPARTTIEVPRFRGDVQVEFDAVAHRVAGTRGPDLHDEATEAGGQR